MTSSSTLPGREHWIARLSVYAHRLAFNAIPALGPAICRECRAPLGRPENVHASGCPAGQVLHALDQLDQYEQRYTERGRGSAGAAAVAGAEAPVEDGPGTVAGEPAAKRGGRASYPPPSPSEEQHLIRLIFRSRQLVRARLVETVPGLVRCSECCQFLMPLGDGHLDSCLLGEVARELRALGDQQPAGASLPASAPPAAGVSREEYGEPWRIDSDAPSLLLDRNGIEVFDMRESGIVDEDEQAYARRIAACLNAAAGIPTPALEALRPWQLMAHMRESRAALERVLAGASAAGERPLRGEDALFGEKRSCQAPACGCDARSGCEGSPSAEDLDRVAEEQRTAAVTGGAE